MHSAGSIEDLLSNSYETQQEQRDGDTTDEEGSSLISEKVRGMAQTIYAELERIIARYDQAAVQSLMPILVNVLDNFAHTDHERHALANELELLRSEHGELLNQYEREKRIRKDAETRVLEIEDGHEEDKSVLEEKLISLESICKMQEIRSKNLQDHITRLEDREGELKQENSRLHDRCNELLKTNLDYVDRLKLLSQQSSDGGADSKRQSQTSFAPSLTSSTVVSPSDEAAADVVGLPANPSHQANFDVNIVQQLISRHRGETVNDQMSLEDVKRSPTTKDGNPAAPATGKVGVDRKMTNSLLLADADDYHDAFAADDNNCPGSPTSATPSADGGGLEPSLSSSSMTPSRPVDIVGAVVESRKRAVDGDLDLAGMVGEVEYLIKENQDLLDTKNALNVVKDDLITQLEQAQNESELLRQEIASLQAVRNKQARSLENSDNELKRLKEQLAKYEDVPHSQKKRFTRVEMARVLMERNQYKEQLMTLQDAIRWQETMRANRELGHDMPTASHRKHSGGSWFKSLFGKLFSPTGSTQKTHVDWSASNTVAGPVDGSVRFVSESTYSPKEVRKIRSITVDTGHVERSSSPDMDRHMKKALQFLRHPNRPSQASPGEGQSPAKYSDEDLWRSVQQNRSDDGRIQAYGWSLPATKETCSIVTAGVGGAGQLGSAPVPVPVFCRPLLSAEHALPGTVAHLSAADVSQARLCCAAGVICGQLGLTDDGLAAARKARERKVAAHATSLDPPRENHYSDIDDDEARLRATSIESTYDSSDQSAFGEELSRLDEELREHLDQMRDLEERQQNLSSLAWLVCSVGRQSRVVIVDVNNPSEYLDSFPVSKSSLCQCISSVPSARATDYFSPFSLSDSTDESTDQSCRTVVSRLTVLQTQASRSRGNSSVSSAVTGSNCGDEMEELLVRLSCVTADQMAAEASRADRDGRSDRGDSVLSTDSRSSCDDSTQLSTALPTMWLGLQNGWLVLYSPLADWRRRIGSVRLPAAVMCATHVKGRVFVGLSDGRLIVFNRRSDNAEWNLNELVQLTVHKTPADRPLISRPYANDKAEAEAETEVYESLEPLCNVNTTNTESVESAGETAVGEQLSDSFACLRCVANRYLWAALGSRIIVLDPRSSLAIAHSFTCYPSTVDDTVRDMKWVGDGVWVSMCVDPVLRLYHAVTYELVEQLDIRPSLATVLDLPAAFSQPVPCEAEEQGDSKVAENGKKSLLRITAFHISGQRLWVGTNIGAMMSFPFVEFERRSPVESDLDSFVGRPGAPLRIYQAPNDTVQPSSFMPICSVNNAHISFHGHRDAVAFLVSVPGSYSTKNSNAVRSELCFSGGQGYRDFRTRHSHDGAGDEADDGATDLSCHLIVWQMAWKET